MRWLLIALLLAAGHARAADMEACHHIAERTESFIAAATGDDKLAKYVSDRSYSHCLLVDEVPVKITMFGDQGVAPATDAFNNIPPDTATDPTAGSTTDPTTDKDPKWLAWCRRHFPKSFNPDTGMVRTRAHGKWKVIPCPM